MINFLRVHLCSFVDKEKSEVGRRKRLPRSFVTRNDGLIIAYRHRERSVAIFPLMRFA
jgi:hypothetical protein